MPVKWSKNMELKDGEANDVLEKLQSDKHSKSIPNFLILPKLPAEKLKYFSKYI